MRKGIIIGLMVIVVIAVVAFVFTQPKEGTVEWHKREYVAAGNGTLFERFFGRKSRRANFGTESTERLLQIERHKKALIELGYLRTTKFVITNREMHEVFEPLKQGPPRGPQVRREHQHFTMISPGVNADTNVIWITAPRETMSELEEFIRQADVP